MVHTTETAAWDARKTERRRHGAEVYTDDKLGDTAHTHGHVHSRSPTPSGVTARAGRSTLRITRTSRGGARLVQCTTHRQVLL
ncbi:hypothetical protein BaRGS_00017051 [Batillaria attramentaria]|uniref:Uncharacterized protein n=1 Tax=Batillaria attramentaria TaxID=370345 RepID=A0ABD0KXA2_9CAEN